MLNKTTCRYALVAELASSTGVPIEDITASSQLYKPRTPPGRRPASLGIEKTKDALDEIIAGVTPRLFGRVAGLRDVMFEAEDNDFLYPTVGKAAERVILPGCQGLISGHLLEMAARRAGANPDSVLPGDDIELVGNRSREAWVLDLRDDVRDDLPAAYHLSEATLRKLRNPSKTETYGDAVNLISPSYEKAMP